MTPDFSCGLEFLFLCSWWIEGAGAAYTCGEAEFSAALFPKGGRDDET